MYVYTEKGKALKATKGITVEVGQVATFCFMPIEELSPTTKKWLENGLIEKKEDK